MEKFKNWMIDTASIMFKEDGNPDFRSLPKSTRLSILLQLSFVWSVIFSIYVFQYETMALGFGAVMLAHALLIFAVYYTFKQFHNIPYVKKPDPNDPPMYDDVWYGS